MIDRRSDSAWFLGQALLAPSFVVDRYRAQLVADHPGRMVPADDPPFEPAFGRSRELGTLYTSVAGLLNLLALLDVVYRPAPVRGGARQPPKRPAANAEAGKDAA